MSRINKRRRREYGNHFFKLIYVLVNEKSGKEIVKVKTSLACVF